MLRGGRHRRDGLSRCPCRIDAAVTYGIGARRGGDAFVRAAGDRLHEVGVGDGARDLQQTVMRTGGELMRRTAIPTYPRPPRRMRRVFVGNVRGFRASVARLAPPLHAPDCSPRFLVRYGRNLYVDIDAVEQRSADLSEIALNDGPSAPHYRFEVDGREMVAGPGANMIVTVVGLDLFFEEISANATPGVPPNQAKLAPILERHGLTLAGPTLANRAVAAPTTTRSRATTAPSWPRKAALLHFRFAAL
jgi:hypothetical protein